MLTFVAVLISLGAWEVKNPLLSSARNTNLR